MDNSTGPRIGIVGLGLMGHGIAANVLRHGYPLTGLEHPGNQPLDDLRAAGLTTVDGTAALAGAVDIVLLCLTGTPEVETVLLGRGGVLQGLRPGSVVIDCSTAIPTSTERVAQAVVQAGGRFLDAAMTRTPKEAAEGRLNLLVGGDAALLAECRPLLACFAENIVHAGPVGAGHRMKLLHNFVSLGCVALIAEAAACATGAGVAPEVFLEVLAQGGGGGAALERLRPWLLEHDASGLRFSVSNALKDLGYYVRMAEDGQAAGAIAQGVLATLQGAHAARPDALMPELVEILARP